MSQAFAELPISADLSHWLILDPLLFLPSGWGRRNQEAKTQEFSRKKERKKPGGYRERPIKSLQWLTDYQYITIYVAGFGGRFSYWKHDG